MVDVSEEIASLRKELSSLQSSIADMAKEGVAKAADRMQSAKADAQQKFADVSAQAHDKLSVCGSNFEDTIERNPFTSVLVALLVGIFLGAIGRGHR